MTNDKSNRFTHRYIDLKWVTCVILACRICNAWSSSWVDDFKQAGHKNPFWGKQNYDFKWYENEEYWQQLETVLLPTLTQLIYMAVNLFNQTTI